MSIHDTRRLWDIDEYYNHAQDFFDDYLVHLNKLGDWHAELRDSAEQLSWQCLMIYYEAQPQEDTTQ